MRKRLLVKVINQKEDQGHLRVKGQKEGHLRLKATNQIDGHLHQKVINQRGHLLQRVEVYQDHRHQPVMLVIVA